jgi:Xaa-Pro dipeptidase
MPFKELTMANDWTKVRYDLDISANFGAIYNSPWYTDAVYDKFSDAEFARRHALAREKMARDGLDALILPGSPNVWSFGAGVTWASGLIEERAMCQYVVLPREGEPMLVYSHPGCHIEAARKMVSIGDVRGSQHGHFGAVMADYLAELGLQTGRIGITAADRTGPEYMGVMAYRDLTEHLPQATFVFLPQLFHELTHIKGEEEIAAMAKAGELVIKSLEAVVAAAKPGAYEYQLEAAATYAIMNGGGRVHFLIIGSTSMHDPKMVFPNPRPSQRVLQEGDIILTEMVAAYKGYTAKIGHPITIGKPTDMVRRFYEEIVVPGYRAIEAKLVTGNTLEDVRQAGSLFRERGAQSRPILAHGLDLITALPFISIDQVRGEPFDMNIVPGMTYAIEITPINAEGTFGIFLSRSYVTTEDGHRCLTPYPPDEIIVA